MRAFVTGGTGFIGSTVVELFQRWGAEVDAPAHRTVPPGWPASTPLDLLDATAVARRVAEARPDGVVHCAILNDLDRLYADRRAGWDAYVEATRHVVDAANAVGAAVLYVSTDWVFDGTQARATEATPPNPINLYGVLKAMGELVVLERADRPIIARVAGVNGLHRARPQTPRSQDTGFGYFVASLVDALRAGEPFTVWESDHINTVATPSLASECAAMCWRALDRGVTGVLHTCGADAVTRWELAERAVEVFELDAALLRRGAPPPEAMPPGPVPYDTSLDATVTAERLGTALMSLDELLGAFRLEVDTGELHPKSGPD